MNKNSHFLVCLSLFLLASLGEGKNQDFMLVLEWAPTHCITHTCVIPAPESFIIHGVWIASSSASRPKSPELYSSSTLENDLRRDLKVHWPGLTMSNEDLWKHEWDHHGSFTGLSAKEYFQKSWNARKKLGFTIEKDLKSKGMSPSDAITHKSEVIGQAIKGSTKIIPKLSCKIITDEKGNEMVLLYRVTFYLDEKFNPVDADLHRHTIFGKKKYIYAMGCKNRDSIMIPPAPPLPKDEL